MEKIGRKKSVCSTSKRYSIDYNIDPKTNRMRGENLNTPRTRPATTMTKRSINRTRKLLKTQPDQNSFIS